MAPMLVPAFIVVTDSYLGDSGDRRHLLAAIHEVDAEPEGTIINPQRAFGDL